MYRIDLNSDLGESFGRYTLGLDDQIIPLVSSANIACGQHAGDPVVMRKTVGMAKDAGIAIGAHPGYPDLQGFGRRDMHLSPDEAYSYMLYQIGALQAFCSAQGVQLAHVKPHGQLYNHAAVDSELAAALAQAVRDVDPKLVLVGLANSALVDEGRKLGLVTAEEFFADRNYTDEGRLVSRNDPAALIRDEEHAIERVKNAIREGAEIPPARWPSSAASARSWNKTTSPSKQWELNKGARPSKREPRFRYPHASLCVRICPYVSVCVRMCPYVSVCVRKSLH